MNVKDYCKIPTLTRKYMVCADRICDTYTASWLALMPIILTEMLIICNIFQNHCWFSKITAAIKLQTVCKVCKL